MARAVTALAWSRPDRLGLHSERSHGYVPRSSPAPGRAEPGAIIRDTDEISGPAALAWYRLDRDLAFENVWRVAHHRYTHGLGYVLLTGIVAWFLASREHRPRGALWAMAASAVHNFCDLVGGGAEWPIHPWWPLSDRAFGLPWSWGIGEWPNVALLMACLMGGLLYARLAGRSPLECFGNRADAWLLRVVRQEGGAATAGEARRRWIIWGLVLLLVVGVVGPLVVGGGL